MEQTITPETNNQEIPGSATLPETTSSQTFLYNTLVALLSKKNIATLANEICKVYATLLRVREAALFLEDDEYYRVCGSLGIREKKVSSVSLSRTSPFIKKLKELKKSLVFKKQGDFSLDEFQIFYLRKALTRFVLDYVVILKDQRRFLGFIILGKSQNEGGEAALNAETSRLVEYLGKQAMVLLEQKIFFEQFQKIQGELKAERQIKDYVLEHVDAGVVFIEYTTKRIEYLNPYIKEMFGIMSGGEVKGRIKILGKKIDEALHQYPAHPFSDFLRVCKEAKISRRSLSKPLFYEHKMAEGKATYSINASFIKKGARGIELIVARKK